MNSIFSFNNPVTQFLVKLLKLLWLNILWILTSLPIITIGASTCALYFTTMRLARDEEGYLTKDFFTSFKSSFKNATIFLLLIAIVIFVCCADFFFFGKSPAFLVKLLAFVIAGFLLCFSLIAVYFLPLTAQFENSIAGTFQTAVGITLQNIHWSICLLILNIILPLVILFQFLPLVVFGLPLPIFFQAYILNNIFRKYVPNGQFTPGSIARIQKKNP